MFRSIAPPAISPQLMKTTPSKVLDSCAGRVPRNSKESRCNPTFIVNLRRRCVTVHTKRAFRIAEINLSTGHLQRRRKLLCQLETRWKLRQILIIPRQMFDGFVKALSSTNRLVFFYFRAFLESSHVISITNAAVNSEHFYGIEGFI